MPPRRWGEPGHQGERTSPDAAAKRPACLTPFSDTFIPVVAAAQLAERARRGCTQLRQGPDLWLSLSCFTAVQYVSQVGGPCEENRRRRAVAVLILFNHIQTREIC